jgi:hypothetical protein
VGRERVVPRESAAGAPRAGADRLHVVVVCYNFSRHGAR